MMGLADIRDWVETLGIGKNFYIGKLDNKKEKSVGIYQRRPSGNPDIALGGMDNTKTATKQVSILIHWNKYANETEEVAQALYDKFLNVTDLTIAGKHVDYLRLEVPEPIDVGTDDNGVYERVIWLDFIYER
ncbi:MAG: minor capsid protein [Faecalicatena sp.]|uniref:phage tail terminator protein n=1 Tax=Faecalicatena sp. TaxID=2005360 RepID=UPI0025873859|nr:minor capsid protein [Faecalicatena sp.]MCI6467450.1 minor capsid protein [Faecalicatena sp.]MDY5618150.1 minor capsid protein [Lachnospiraceae bacterium]